MRNVAFDPLLDKYREVNSASLNAYTSVYRSLVLLMQGEENTLNTQFKTIKPKNQEVVDVHDPDIIKAFNEQLLLEVERRLFIYLSLRVDSPNQREHINSVLKEMGLTDGSADLNVSKLESYIGMQLNRVVDRLREVQQITSTTGMGAYITELIDREISRK